MSSSTPDYQPKIDPADWALVREFTESAVRDSEGQTPYADKDLLSSCARLAQWCRRSAGLDLDRETVFRRQVIDRFTQVGLPDHGEASRGNIRSQLLRMSEALLDTRLAPPRLAPLSRASASAPYTRKELISLRSWAAHQSTAARRANAEVLLALGAGAGLTAREIGELRTSDIEVDELGVVVHVHGERNRQVPVLHEWATVLAERSRRLKPDLFAFRENHRGNYDNLISNFVARSKADVQPQSQRLRATWIVRHLETGTPVVPLLRAAGVESLEAFTRYLPYVANLPPAPERTALTMG
ncbi:MAG: hypothetical protein WED09_13790 [Homoserinimonas sp.]